MSVPAAIRSLAEPLRGRGHRLPETVASLAERDRLLRQMAIIYCKGESQREAARHLHRVLLRYRDGAWRRENVLDVCPTRHAGNVNAYCWRLLRLRDAVPSPGTIRRVVAFREPRPALVFDA